MAQAKYMKTTLLERRVGTREEAPKSVTLRAGKLTAEFVTGGLRTVRFEGHEVLRAIAYVVRDSSWGTYNPEITECSISRSDGSFAVTYRGRCASADPSQALTYQASVPEMPRGIFSSRCSPNR